MITRAVALTGLGGGLLAALGAAAVAAGPSPTSTSIGSTRGSIVFAVGLRGPVRRGRRSGSTIARRCGPTIREKRWERALSRLGRGRRRGPGSAFALIGASAGFDPATAAGAIAIVGLFDIAC